MHLSASTPAGLHYGGEVAPCSVFEMFDESMSFKVGRVGADEVELIVQVGVDGRMMLYGGTEMKNDRLVGGGRKTMIAVGKAGVMMRSGCSRNWVGGRGSTIDCSGTVDCCR